MKPKASNFIKGVQASIVKHSPEILVGLGISGMIATTVLAVRATPKALSILESKAKEEDCLVEDISVKEKVSLCWRCYIPAVITGVTSASCIIGASSINGRRNAMLTAAYTLSDSALREYREAVIETVGEKKERTIREKVAEKRIQNHPASTSEIIITEQGNTLCYDMLSGRYFKSDIEKINRAVNELNKNMIADFNMCVSLNDFYDELGLEHTKIGDDLGWKLDDGLVEIEFSSHITDDGKPCLVIDYRRAPKYGFTSQY